MEKDFDKWNIFKKELEDKEVDLVIKEGEIWWTNFGLNIKTESCGKGKDFRRPVLVLRKLSHENFIIIPLSTKLKDGTWFAKYEVDGVQYSALLYQIKMLNKNRFYVNEGKLERKQFLEIKKRLKNLLNL
ncbi:MAG: type II toxin-antitoxin system PemK/MazF family toxin [Candidatus Gracilibacteria bacterium]|nr:type II toxin-antitoxin system PemK/MazF family toxin [Candidatus Gracilibacteria bacterium]